MTFKIAKTKERDEKTMPVRAFKSQQISKWSSQMMYNGKPQSPHPPISNEGEMRHTVPLYCYKSFFVAGWQLFIRSNLFKPPLRVRTFSTLTHLQFTNLTADLLWEGWGGTLAHFHRGRPLCWARWNGGREEWETVERTDSEFSYLTPD